MFCRLLDESCLGVGHVELLRDGGKRDWAVSRPVPILITDDEHVALELCKIVDGPVKPTVAEVTAILMVHTGQE